MSESKYNHGGSNKIKVSATEISVPKLSFHGNQTTRRGGQELPTNFVDWSKNIKLHLEKEFPFEGQFIELNSYYSYPEPDLIEILDKVAIPQLVENEGNNNLEQINAAKAENKRIKELNRITMARNDNAYKLHDEKLRKVPEKREAMFSAMLPTISEGSLARMEHMVENFRENVIGNRDPKGLWDAVVATHSVINSGVKYLDSFEALKTLVNMRMHRSEEPYLYRDRLQRQLTVYNTISGEDKLEINSQLMACIFFKGLDGRFDKFSNDTLNDAIREIKQFPNNLEGIYTYANQFVSMSSHQTNNNGNNNNNNNSSKASNSHSTSSSSNTATNNETQVTSSVYTTMSNTPVAKSKKRKNGGSDKSATTTPSNETVKTESMKNADGKFIHPKTGEVLKCGHKGCGGNHYTSKCPKKNKKVRIDSSVNVVTDSNVFAEIINNEDEYLVELLDNCCSNNLQMVNNLVHVSKLIQLEQPFEIGVGGKLVKFNHSCETKYFGRAYFSEEAPHTIWSQSNVASLYEIESFDNTRGMRVILKNGKSIEFHSDPQYGGLMIRRSKIDKKQTSNEDNASMVFVQSVQESMKGFTNDEIKRAKLVQDFIEQQGFISEKNILHIISKGTWVNLPFTSKDVINRRLIYGHVIPTLKGKGKKVAQENILMEEIPRKVVSAVELLLDFMFVNGIPFLVSLGVPQHFGIVSHAVKGRGMASIWSLLEYQIHFWTSNLFTVRRVRMDLEGGLMPLIPRLNGLGIIVANASPGDHVPKVERLIQTIKGTVRSLKASVPIEWPKIVIVNAVYFAMKCFNLSPSSAVPDGEIPWTRVLGFKPDYKRESRAAFMHPAEAQVPDPNNSMAERTTTVFNLGPEIGSKTGAYIFFNPLSSPNKVISRSQFTLVPFSNYHVALIKRVVSDEKSPIKNQSELIFSRGINGQPLEYLPEEENDFSHPGDGRILIDTYRSLHEVRGVLPDPNNDNQPQADGQNGQDDELNTHLEEEPNNPSRGEIANEEQQVMHHLGPSQTNSEQNTDKEVSQSEAILDHQMLDQESGNVALSGVLHQMLENSQEDIHHMLDRTDGAPQSNIEQQESSSSHATGLLGTGVAGTTTQNQTPNSDDSNSHFPGRIVDNNIIIEDQGVNKFAKASDINGDAPNESNDDSRMVDGLNGLKWKVSASSKRVSKPNSKYIYRINNPNEHNIKVDQRKVEVYRVTQTPKQAIKEKGQVAIDALYKEISNLDRLKAFKPVKRSSLTMKQIKSIINTFTFMEDKFDPTSKEYIKTKARMVANGKKQRAMEKFKKVHGISDASNYSPTVQTQSLFMGAAKERRFVGSLDVPTAYIHAAYPDDDNEKDKVFIKLNSHKSKILVEIHPEYKQYLLPDGGMVVQLLKALYGLLDSAKLWNDEFTNTLTQDGYIQNEYDACVFNKVVDEVQVSVYVHVDDLMVTSKNEDLIKDLHRVLQNKYGTMQLNLGKVHSFLGMTFDFTEDGKVKIKMDKFIKELLEKAKIHGNANTPAGENLFDVRENLEILGSDEHEECHSLVASLLYLSKRTRPDILTAVGFLTRRVNKFNDNDKKKLHRVFKYLNWTKDLEFTLCFNREFQVISSVDAAYGVTHDFKSMSGATTSLGGGSLHAQSKAQSLTTKSSFEAELVSLSDYGGRVIWTQNFLRAQGYEVQPARIEQDNQGTMAAIQKGNPPSDRSRHINIRYFWLTDLIKSDEVTVNYVPTDLMISDILTKPLQGEKFKRFRNKLLGIEERADTCYLIMMGSI